MPSVELERSSSGADVGPSFTALPARDAGVFDRQAGVTLDCRADGSPTPEVTWVTADGRQVTSVSGIRLVDKGEIRSVEARCPLFINIHCLIFSSLYLAHMLVHHDFSHFTSPSFNNLHCSSDGRVLFHGILRCAKNLVVSTDATGSVVLYVHNHSS